MSNRAITPKKLRQRRHARARAKIFGTPTAPRLAVFRSGKHIYAQLINDQAGRTLAAASDLGLKRAKDTSKLKQAAEVGRLLGEAARAQKLERVRFDRGGYLYAGRVKALAEGARAAGLQF